MRLRSSGTAARSRRWSNRRERWRGAGEIPQIALALAHRRHFIGHQQVDHAVRYLHRNRPHLLGPELAQPAALDHGRAAHADAGIRRGNHRIATAEQSRIAGETTARGDAKQRRLA